MITFDFDDIHVWGPRLSDHFSSMVSLAFASATICACRPKYLGDAVKIFFSNVYQDKARFTAAVVGWIKAQTVAAYHGSRVDDAVIDAIRREPLRTIRRASTRISS